MSKQDGTLSLKDTKKGLRYIAESPPQAFGGFHAQTVMIAKSALKHLSAVAKKNCGDWCEYYGGDCHKDPQLPDYCPIYNPMTGKHHPKRSN